MPATSTTSVPVRPRRELSPVSAGLLTIGGTALAILGGLLVGAALLAGVGFAMVSALMDSL